MKDQFRAPPTDKKATGVCNSVQSELNCGLVSKLKSYTQGEEALRPFYKEASAMTLRDVIGKNYGF